MRRSEDAPLYTGRRPTGAQGGGGGQDPPRLRLQRPRQPGTHHQRRQAGRLHGVRDPPRPWRRGAAARSVLDDLPGVDPACRRHGGGRRDHSRPGLPGHGGAAGGGSHPPYEGSGVLLAVQPDRRCTHTRGSPGDRALGRRCRAVGDRRRDLRASGVRRRPVRLPAGRGPRDRRPLHRRQRRRQDLCDDRVAGRLAHRAGGCRQGSYQPAVPCRVQRLQCGAGGGAGSRGRPAGRGGPDAPRLRPTSPDHAPHALRHPRRGMSDARRRFLLLPVVARCNRSHTAGTHPDDLSGPDHAHPRGGRRRDRAR